MAKYLIDTQAIIWAAENNKKNLSENARNIIGENKDDFFVSIASIWEMAIKISIGKLELTFTLEEVIEKLADKNYQLLPILANHALKVRDLPLHHRDPFDRIIIAQAITENLEIISSDIFFDAYPIKRIW